MTYDGTLTVADPAHVKQLDGVPDGFRADIVRDESAEPPDWDGIGYVLRIDYVGDYPRGDVLTSGDYGDKHGAEDMLGTVRELWHEYRDWETVGRLLRFHGVSSFDYSTGLDRDGTVVAVVTRAQAEAWGVRRRDRGKLAQQALDVFRQYVEGDVYGVIVSNLSTGEDASLWGIYDGSSDLTYCRDVAADLLAEVTPEERTC